MRTRPMVKNWRSKEYRNGSNPGGSGRRVHTPSSTRTTRAKLDKLFTSEEEHAVASKIEMDVTPPQGASSRSAHRQKLIRHARKAQSREEFNALVSALVTHHSLPDDAQLLTRALDHPSELVLQQVLDALIELDGTRKLRPRKEIQAKLSALPLSDAQPHTKALVEMLSERL